MLRLWKDKQKNLAIALALILALSSFGGVPALAWAHADGSFCATCTVAEPVSQEEDSCCTLEQTAASLSAADCQVCCEAEVHEDSHQQLLRVGVADLAEQPATARRGEVCTEVLAAPPHVTWRTVPYLPPSLRAPPVAGGLI